MVSFLEIDARRRTLGLTRQAVCDRAGMNTETWRRTAKNVTSPTLRTLERLIEALDALEREGAGHA